MKFVDEAEIYVKAGRGGRGCLSFRREKYVPKGGPDGGDGGKGGDVILRGNKDLISLLDFKYKRNYRAENGKNGGGNNKKGRDGADLIIPVPIGTVVYNDKGFIGEILKDGESLVVAKGGRGGRGNASFASPTNRAPRTFEYGEEGEERHLKLVLKILSDFGIIGPPNVGKSTLLKKLTEAQPKIGDYPFTTLTPNLGSLTFEDRLLVIADIPGIIKGASKGRGLGLDFLKHVERCKMLLWMFDLSSSTLKEDYEILKEELSSYNQDLLRKRRILLLNKSDLVSREKIEAYVVYFRRYENNVLPVSALTGHGIDELKNLLREIK